MSVSDNDPEMRRLAQQLSNPNGPDGIEVGKLMAQSNASMTDRCMGSLPIQDGQVILEIGHGNGSHIPDLLRRGENLTYHGAEISETMIQEAVRLNEAGVESGNVQFHLTDGRSLPLPDDSVDIAFSVNTIYFWEDVPSYLAEIRRVLAPGGTLGLCFTTRSFMKQLPFTQFGFTQFEEEDISKLLVEAGFQIAATHQSIEEVTSKDGQSVKRPVVVVSAVA